MSMMLHRAGIMSAPLFRGLLDLYPGAAAAYSLRALSASFLNQPIIRVRRSSDNTESDFTAAQITDGTLTTWTGANDGFVRTWYDQSGNARNAEQTTAGSQPQIVSSGSLVTDGGLPAVRYNGTSTGFRTASFAWGSDQMESFGAIKTATNAPAKMIFELSDNLNSNNGAFFFLQNATTSVRFQCQSKGTSSTGVLENSQLLDPPLKVLYNTRSQISTPAINSFYNGIESSSTASQGSGNYGDHPLNIGARENASRLFFDGIMHEAIFYNSLKSDRADIRANINVAWGGF